MILKIERYSGGQKWWMLDNIAKISVSEVKKYRANGNNEFMDDIHLLDMAYREQPPVTGCNCCGENECETCKFIDYIQLVCRVKEDGGKYEEFSIAFDTICYVLNDNGKTIEKIVVNYND